MAVTSFINNSEQQRVERKLIINALKAEYQHVDLVENGIGSLLKRGGSKAMAGIRSGAGKASAKAKGFGGSLKSGYQLGKGSPDLAMSAIKSKGAIRPSGKVGMAAGMAAGKIGGFAKKRSVRMAAGGAVVGGAAAGGYAAGRKRK